MSKVNLKPNEFKQIYKSLKSAGMEKQAKELFDKYKKNSNIGSGFFTDILKNLASKGLSAVHDLLQGLLKGKGIALPASVSKGYGIYLPASHGMGKNGGMIKKKKSKIMSSRGSKRKPITLQIP